MCWKAWGKAGARAGIEQKARAVGGEDAGDANGGAVAHVAVLVVKEQHVPVRYAARLVDRPEVASLGAGVNLLRTPLPN